MFDAFADVVSVVRGPRVGGEIHRRLDANESEDDQHQETFAHRYFPSGCFLHRFEWLLVQFC